MAAKIVIEVPRLAFWLRRRSARHHNHRTRWRTPLSEHNLPRFYYVHKPHGSPTLKHPGVAPTGPWPEDGLTSVRLGGGIGVAVGGAGVSVGVGEAAGSA